MKNKLTLAVLVILTTHFFFACNTEKSNQEADNNTLVLETLKIERKAGPDCDKPDSLRMNCVEVNFLYPSLKTGPDALKTVIETWSKDFMTSLVAFAEEPDNMPALEEAIQNFFNMHDESVRDFPDGPAYFIAETKDTVLLNDGKYLTLQMDGYSYAGGAHPNSTSTVATWDVTAAQRIKIEDIVTDLSALKQMAERKFREVKAEAFREGFDFDEIFPFKLADNSGLVKDGLYFCYVPYEVGPYALGYTEFVIPFDEIKQILK